MMIEFRAKCPKCETIRTIAGPWEIHNPAEADRMEMDIDRAGHVVARCPTCDTTEHVAMYIDGKQTEPWRDADEYESEHGKNAGPLPPKPWPDSN